MEPKMTRLYARSEEPNHCPVECYKQFIQRRPEANGGKACSAFYLSVIHAPKGKMWYKPIPLGLHSIQSTTKQLLKGSNIEGFVSNSSLRRTAQNRLLTAGIPKEIIHKKTGRISDAADSAYIDQRIYEKQMSNALYSNCNNSEYTLNNVSKATSSPVQFSNCNNCTVSINYNFNK